MDQENSQSGRNNMGGGTFNTGASAARSNIRQTTGTTAFQHAAQIAAGTIVSAVHSTLQTDVKNRRECRDSADNPLSVPIGVIVDITGSMGGVAEEIINDLHKVFQVIQKTGSVEYPSICFGAIGDARCGDKAVIQIGEFEADDELAEQHLGNIWAEGGGGGNGGESYDLALYFFANQVDTDHWEKRGQKGLLFVIGDEPYFPETKATELKKYFGLSEASNTTFGAIVAKLLERWEVFVLRPSGTSHYSSPAVRNVWVKHFGEERVINVEDWKEIPTLIGTTISVVGGASLEDTLNAAKVAGMQMSQTTSSSLIAISTTSTVPATVETEKAEDSQTVRL